MDKIDNSSLERELRNKDVWQHDFYGNSIKQGDILLKKTQYDVIARDAGKIDLLRYLTIWSEEGRNGLELWSNVEVFKTSSLDCRMALSRSLARVFLAALSKVFTVAEYFKVKDAEWPVLFIHFPSSIHCFEGASYGRLTALVSYESDKNGQLDYISTRALSGFDPLELEVVLPWEKLVQLHKLCCQEGIEPEGGRDEFIEAFVSQTASLVGCSRLDFKQLENGAFSVPFSKTNEWKAVQKTLRGVMQRYSVLKKTSDFYSFHIKQSGHEVDDGLEPTGNYNIDLAGGSTMFNKNGILAGLEVWAEMPRRPDHKEYFFNSHNKDKQ